MDKYEIIVVPDVRTLLWGIFSIFPILLPLTFSGAALVAACKWKVSFKRKKNIEGASTKAHDKGNKKGFRAKYRIEGTGIEGAHSINWCKFLCTIMSCTLFMVLSSKLVSVALVKWT